MRQMDDEPSSDAEGPHKYPTERHRQQKLIRPVYLPPAIRAPLA